MSTFSVQTPRSTPMRDWGVILGALGFAALIGALVSLGRDEKLAAFLIAACVTLWMLSQLVSLTQSVPFLLISGGVLLMAADGLRPTTALTYSDLLIVAAMPPLAWSVLTGKWLPKLPTWLLVGTAMIVFSALLVEEFPSHSLDQAIFQYKNLSTGEVAPASSLALAGQLLIALVIVPTVVGLCVTTWHQARLLVSLWMIGVAGSCVIALLAAFAHIDFQQILTGHNYAVQAFHNQAGRFTGLAVHPNLLGISAAMTVPIALSRLSNTQSILKYGPLIAIYSLAALISGSRSAVIGLLMAFIIMFVWQSKARKRMLTIFAAGGIAGYLTGLTGSSLSAIQRLFGSNVGASATTSISNEGRLSSYTEALHAFYARPLTGYGFQGLRGAHNVILELLSSGGVIAFLGYTTIIVGSVVVGWKLKPGLPHRMQMDMVGLIVAVLVFLTVSMVDNASLDRFVYAPIALILGLTFVMQRQVRGLGSKSFSTVVGER